MTFPWQWKRRALRAEAQYEAMYRMIFGTPGLLDLAKRAVEERTEMKLKLREMS